MARLVRADENNPAVGEPAPGQQVLHGNVLGVGVGPERKDVLRQGGLLPKFQHFDSGARAAQFFRQGKAVQHAVGPVRKPGTLFNASVWNFVLKRQGKIAVHFARVSNT